MRSSQGVIELRKYNISTVKDGIVDKHHTQNFDISSEVAKSQGGSCCIQESNSFQFLLVNLTINLTCTFPRMEHGSEKNKRIILNHPLDGLLEILTNE